MLPTQGHRLDNLAAVKQTRQLDSSTALNWDSTAPTRYAHSIFLALYDTKLAEASSEYRPLSAVG